MTDIEYNKSQLALLRDQHFKLINKYHQEKLDQYKEIAPLNSQFTRMIQAEVAKMW